MRGQLPVGICPRLERRIIPARAGPTTAGWGSSRRTPDHPRACGANVGVFFNPESHSGSSPRVRGQHPDPFAGTDPSRIIPARAGPTITEDYGNLPKTDHPRACGANNVLFHLIRANCGSSPRVRGQPAVHRRPRDTERIIPARAGPTISKNSESRAGADHPRACGANHVGGVLAEPLDLDHPRACGANEPKRTLDRPTGGSSPRVRGQRTPIREGSQKVRIIPARAGPTCRSTPCTYPPADHPRACGANALSSSSMCRSSGSSPRVRGQHRAWPSPEDARRIIPARAGPTLSGKLGAPDSPDHPRACGANSVILCGKPRNEIPKKLDCHSHHPASLYFLFFRCNQFIFRTDDSEKPDSSQSSWHHYVAASGWYSVA